MNNTSRHNRQSGFALLFVFAMAAIIGITYYVMIPAIGFEAQRDKEELLITRGEQYERAIQLYVRKNKRYPGKMEDLDNSNGLRYLRHHYADPFTGKDEWRLIHAGPGGVLVDSLVKKDDKDKKAPIQSSITELAGLAGLPAPDTTSNLALRKRPSDQQQPGAGLNGFPGPQPGAPIPPDPTSPPQSNGALAGVTNPGNPLGTGLPQPGVAGPGTLPVPNPAGSAVNSQSGGISAGPAMGSSYSPAPIPGVVNSQIQAVAANMAQGGLQSAATPNGQGANQAADLIRGLLTTPRAGGLAGVQSAATTATQTIGGGIAGVASTVKTGTGIKIYNDQDEYKKWEFVYDPNKELQKAGGFGAAPAAPGTPIGQPVGTAPGTPVGSPTTIGPK